MRIADCGITVRAATVSDRSTPDGVTHALADPHEGAIFSVMAYTGLRFGEVRDLCWSDVLLDQGESGFIVVRLGGSAGVTKTRRAGTCP